MTTQINLEQLRDQRHADADQARQRLADAKKDFDEADAAFDGSKPAAARWENADRIHRLSLREFATLEQKFLEAERAIEEPGSNSSVQNTFFCRTKPCSRRHVS